MILEEHIRDKMHRANRSAARTAYAFIGVLLIRSDKRQNVGRLRDSAAVCDPAVYDSAVYGKCICFRLI